VATVVGILINFVDIDPIKALFWAAVLNGVVAVPLMVVIMIMAMQERVIGQIHPAAAALGHGLVIHCSYGRRRRDHVRDLMN
jgi:Mn2+/Fe2+ NRAMP family transporter